MKSATAAGAAAEIAIASARSNPDSQKHRNGWIVTPGLPSSP
jgi:hypothetical protein